MLKDIKVKQSLWKSTLCFFKPLMWSEWGANVCHVPVCVYTCVSYITNITMYLEGIINSSYVFMVLGERRNFPASSVQASLNVNLFSASTDFNRQEEIKENQEKKKCLGHKNREIRRTRQNRICLCEEVFFCLFLSLQRSGLMSIDFFNTVHCQCCLLTSRDTTSDLSVN